jgi:pimeloyl-ACP methyl ester carboxylesterase
MKDKYIHTNGIKIHYIEYEGNQPSILLLHGLSANAHAFDGLILAGLAPKFHILSVDLRGRGQSDKPQGGYTMEQHALDIVGILKSLGISQIILGGHSFGAFLSMYISCYYPELVEKLILMDAGIKMHPNTREMLRPALSRLETTYASFDEYLQTVKQAPYLQNAWSDTMLSYYQADVQIKDGLVKPNSNINHIAAAMEDPLTLDWEKIASSISQKTLFFHALGSYGLEGAPPLLPLESAQTTVEKIKDCKYVEVKGNHQTMLYNEGSNEIVIAIKDFL